MTKRIVIHRDRTFEYDGVKYRVLGAHASTGNSYEICTMDFDPIGDQDWNSLAGLREFLNESAENGWPLLPPKTTTEWAQLMNEETR